MKSKYSLLAMIVLFGCLPGISSDIYAPSVPAISLDLGASINSVQFTMAIFMLGLSLSQLVYGPLSEGIGRRPTLIFGLLITILGNLISVLAPNITVLLAGRLIQGVGSGACALLWRCVFRDTFSGPELSKFVSYLSMLLVFIIPTAPTLGGYLQQYAGWRSVFSFLLIYAVITFVIIYRYLPETSTHHHPERLRSSFIKTTFAEILRHKIFMMTAISVLLTYGMLFSWVIVLPVLLIKHIGISPVKFGWVMLMNTATASMLGSFINSRLVEKVGSKNMLHLGWSLGFLSGFFLLLSYFYFGLNGIAIFSCMFLFYFSANFIWPNTFASAFAPFGHIAGYAASLYGTLQMGGGALVGAIVAYLPDQNQIPLAIVIMISSLLAWRCYQTTLASPRDD